MNIIFPPVDENYIKSKIDEGYYSNATELVRDAVRRLRELDEARSDRLRVALELGRQDIAFGRVTPFSTDLMDELDFEAMELAKKRVPSNPDV